MEITHAVKPMKMTPLSSSQSRIWFMEHFDKSITAYNIPLDYRVKGALDKELLIRSLDYLIARHESMRMVFPKTNGSPVQKVLPELHANLNIVNLENLPEARQEEMIRMHSLENAQYKFNLEKGPMFRFSLLVLGKRDYYFLANFHHIISDATSVGIFLDELETVYQSLQKNKPVDLPPVTVTYTDYTVWQNRWLAGEECRSQLEYWKKELSGVPEVLTLPIDFHRPKIQTYQGSEFHFDISGALREKVVALSKRHGSSLSVPLLSAFGVLLARYSGQEDFVIGVPVANRNHYELENLTGVLINSLPLRFTISGDMTFADTCDFTKKKFLSALENQEVPFEKLVEEMKIKRVLDVSPVFQVQFNFLQEHHNNFRLDGLEFKKEDGQRASAQTDITLTVNDIKTGLHCTLEYNTSLFRRETIGRLAGHWKNLLEGLTDAEELPVDEIPFLTKEEIHHLFVEMNQTDRNYPKDKCIHQLFEDQVKRSPDALAASDDFGRMTYAELNSMANRMARYLVERGAGKGKIVAVFLDRGLNLLVSLLAVAKTGAMYLPVDAIYPKARLALIVEDANPVLLITQNSLLEQVPETGTPVILIEDKKIFSHTDDSNLGLGDPDDPAYILYTSGSTGKPKGVQVRHCSTVNDVLCLGRKLNVNPEDILLSVTTITFDVAEMEIYLPLCHGAKIVIGSQETAMDIELLKNKIGDSGATLLLATPVTFKMLILSGWKGKKDLRVYSGGEGLPKEIARELLSRCKEVWNAYAPTETTIYSLTKRVTEKELEGEGYVMLGRPYDNTYLYILNRKRVPVPEGIPGELYIGGEGIATGYFNLPELTSQRFLPDPWSKRPNARMFKTGDLVHYDSEGNVIFMNRLDSQVKIRGFRIELGEIESVLRQYDLVKECVVVVKEDASREKVLVAYFTTEEGAEIDYHEIRQYLKSRIPDYMVPAYFVKMEQFPLTSTLKIDRKALPEPEIGKSQLSNEYAPPETATEQKLARIWSSLLKLDKVGIHDDFFDIGGHSMIAVALMQNIEKELGLRLPLATLFNRSTIHDLGEIIDQGAEPIKWRSLVPIRPAGTKKPLFLVHGMGLNVLLYTTVVNYLDPEMPVYGLQAKGLNGQEEPLTTLEEIAAYYISEIMTVDPEGPYAMAGFSLGGRIAYEMARQLRSMGKGVRFLGLFDAAADDSLEGMPVVRKNLAKLNRTLSYVQWNVAHFFKDPDESMMQIFSRRMRGLRKRMVGLDFKVNKDEMVSKGAMKELPHYLKKVHRANRIADTRYVIRPYDGTVHLFKAKKQTFYIKDPVNYGWDKYARGGVVIHEIPGEHSTTFAPPNDKFFAAVLQDSLNRSSDSDPVRSSEDAGLLQPEETEKVLYEWNRTDADYPRDLCIHQVFERQVARTPDAIAVEYEGQQMTYSDLKSHVNVFAGYLAEQRISRGDVVAVFMERGIDLLAAMLAISKNGAAYLPLNPMNPKARLEMILRDAAPAAILTQSSIAGGLPDAGIKTILADKRSTGSGYTGIISGSPDSIAYILYTSGSTGKPKGVPIKQSSLVNLVHSFGKLLEVSPKDILLSVTTIAFDIAELEFYLPLFNGAKLVIAPQETSMDAEQLIKKMNTVKPTIFQATPVTFRMLTGNRWKGDPKVKLLCGGEAFPKDLARKLLPLCREVWNLYGPTETTIWSVGNKINQSDVKGDGYVPIGRPLDNNRVYVLDTQKHPVRIGQTGELYIGGDGVSPGYLNLPALNAERFINDLFSNKPGSRLYGTGDLVYYMPDGRLMFVGRIDSQIKVRGYRIETGEIESAIARYDGIKEVVVSPKQDPSGENMIAAYYITKDEHDIDHKDLRRFLNEILPEYMIPSFFVRMDHFPLTASMKVDRKALPDPDLNMKNGSGNYVAPSTPTEKKLSAIWSSLLKLRNPGTRDDFFEIGGYSILAVSMITAIEKEFGIRLPLAILSDHRSMESIAKLIDEGGQSVKWRPLVPIKPEGSRKPVFLVHGMGLNVLLYTTLVKHMDPEVPVYGLQAKGMDGKEKPLETIEEIAAHYISEIMTVDEVGPYYMAGFSLGGMIAYEMAVQLRTMGKEVRFLGVFDTALDGKNDDPKASRKIYSRLRHMIRYSAWNIRQFFAGRDETRLMIIRRRLRGLGQRFRGLDFRIDEQDKISMGTRNELPRYLRKVHRTNVRASRNYRMKLFDGSIHVFKAKKQTFYIPDPVHYGWDKYVKGGVILHEIPGEHSTTFAPPNDRIFAEVLQDSLDKSGL